MPLPDIMNAIAGRKVMALAIESNANHAKSKGGIKMTVKEIVTEYLKKNGFSGLSCDN